ncbi:hypothetical protein [Lysinibacillus fusiformis]|uniref:hypothetical protein n=1 Tax=Lysinibacillus fusiformis TaxID=28031 RepID=UPI002E1B61DF|nr:hypothetical protein [Lysinibacillus fusiformis]
MTANHLLIKFFLTSLYAKPKQPIIQVLFILAILYVSIQYVILTFVMYFMVTPEIFLFYNMLLSSGVTYILIVYFAVSVVFSQNDFFIMGHLPISSKHIIMSKIVSGVVLPLVVVSILSIPTFILVWIEWELGIAIKTILFILAMNVFLTLFLLFILSIFNHFRTVFNETSVYLLRIIVILVLGISPIFYFVMRNYPAISVAMEKLDTSTLSSLRASISTIFEIGYRFTMQQSLVEALFPMTTIQSFIYFTAIIILCYVLFKATIIINAVKYYEYGLLVNKREKTTKVWGSGIKGSWVYYLQREYWILQSESYYKMQVIIGFMLTPICTIIFLLSIQMNILKSDWLMNDERYLFVYLVLLMSCINNISGTPYSREGKYYASSITLPFNPWKIYMAKVIVSSCISVGAVLISYIIYTLFGKGDVMTVLFLAMTIFIVIAYNVVTPLYDKKHPFLAWSNPSEAIKSNPTVLISLLYGTPVLIITLLLHFFLLFVGIPSLTATIIISFIALLCTITLIYGVISKMKG